MSNFKFAYQPQIVIKFSSDNEGFEQSASKINANISLFIKSDFIFEVWSNISASKTQFNKIGARTACGNKVFSFSNAQTFVHNHCQSRITRFCRSFGNKIK